MQISNQTSAVAAPSSVSPVQAANNPSQGPFASLLRQSQAPAAAPLHGSASAPPPAASLDSNTSANETDAASQPEAPAAPQAPMKARLKSPDKAPTARPTDHGPKAAAPGDPANEATANKPHEDIANKHNADMRADPALSPWLTPPQRLLDAAALAAGTTASVNTGTDAGDALATATPSSAKPGETPGAPGDIRNDPRARAEARTAALETSARVAEVIDDAAASRSAKPAVEESQSARISNLQSTPAAATFTPAASGPREPTAASSVTLPTPLASPEFAQALGVQISVLATDGVQHAELQLNPADMGPVSVRIVIDGTTAQVDFGADMAATRQAIEAGLPELAGALRDAGFTLTGGGVSQHSRGRGDTRDDSDGSGSSAGLGVDATRADAGGRVLRRTVSAGGVDLYA